MTLKNDTSDAVFEYEEMHVTIFRALKESEKRRSSATKFHYDTRLDTESDTN